MSYQSTTPNLGLPQWVLSDGPQMSDFNGAFQDIDNFAGEKGAANGIATLDADGRLTAAQTAITTGSNANGTWIRFPDGTQICTKIITISMKIETAEGSMYYGTRTSLGDFAMPFTEAPAESLLLTTGPSAFLDVARDITATSAGSVNLYKSLKMPTVGDYPIHVIAIGKWK